MDIFCPHCGAATDANDKFCIICGELVHATAVCGVCGEVVPVAAAFCPNCGMNFLEHPEMSIQRTYGADDAGTGTMGIEMEAVLPSEEDASPAGCGQDAVPQFVRKLPPFMQKVLGADVDVLAAEEEVLGALEVEAGNDGSDDEIDDRVDVEALSGTEAQKERASCRPIRQWFKGKAKPEEVVEDAEEEEDSDAVDDDSESDTDKDDEWEDGRASLFSFFKRKSGDKSVGQRKRFGLIHRLKRENESEVGPDEQMDDVLDSDVEGDEPDLDDVAAAIQEPDADNGERVAKRRSQKKAEEEDEAAMKAFAEKANQDGYYDDVRPLDYGEDDEERDTLDVKVLVLLVLGLSTFCVLVIKLQSMF